MVKLKDIFIIVLVVIMIVFVGYGIIKMIISNFSEVDLITKEEVMLYTIPSNLVTSYSRYYYLEDCLENLVEGCKQDKYKEIYGLYIDDYKKEQEEVEIYEKLKQFESSDIKLKKIYYANNMYILEMILNGDIQYLLMSLETMKTSSYEFAFAK